MRLPRVLVVVLGWALLVSGCASTAPGPVRPFAIEDEIAFTKPLLQPDLKSFYEWTAEHQAAARNEVLTARMYAADVEFHYYEARLTRESQEEGLGATLSSLGLTTAATLVGGAGTKAILSGAASAVIGADKAYNERDLLSNTVQALQSQMRADRKTQSAIIYAQMFRDTGPNTRVPTPIAEYTLPMALSDAEAYYQAGTVASALIGLSRTLADAERNADQARYLAGPNRQVVATVASVAAPTIDTSAPMVVDPGVGPPARGPTTKTQPTVIKGVNPAPNQLGRNRSRLVEIKAKIAEYDGIIQKVTEKLDALKASNLPQDEIARQQLQKQIDNFTIKKKGLNDEAETLRKKI